MATLTRGFASPQQLRNHFQSHGTDFGAPDEATYERLAEEFLVNATNPQVERCVRRCGDIVRFDPTTDAFGILGKDGVIRTFYKPVPCHTLPFARRAMAKAAKACHNLTTNLLYYRAQCTS